MKQPNRSREDNRMRGMKFSLRTVGLAVALVTLSGGFLRAELATIYLTNGEARTVELVSADRGQISWKDTATARQVNQTFRSQVDYVVFPTTPEWREAEELMQSRKFAEAIPAYQKVVASPVTHYYPFPGNYTSLAMYRLLLCYRNLMDINNIAKQANAVRQELTNLPPDFREIDPTNTAWVAFSERRWDIMLEEASKVDPPTPESFFLQGQAYAQLGKKPESIQAFAGVYTLNWGGNLLLTRTAMERSALLLSQLGIPEREIELIAQLKLYRDLFGGGDLWEGASEKLKQLADGEIQTLGEPEGGEMVAKPPPSGGTVIGDTGSSAVVADAASRKYHLPRDLSEQALLINGKKGNKAVELMSGVAKADGGYLFDGTGGGGLLINGIDASKPAIHLRLRFIPETSAAALFEMNEGQGGGLGVYLVGGKATLVWAPKGKPKVTHTIGDVPAGSPSTLDFRAKRKPDGGASLIAILNGQRVVFPADQVGLNLSKSLTATVGDAKKNPADPTLDGKSHPPFEGKIEHVSIGTGESLEGITAKEAVQLGKPLKLTVEG